MNFDISLDNLYDINKIEVFYTRQYIHHITFPMVGGFMYGYATGSLSQNSGNINSFAVIIFISAALLSSLLTGCLVDKFGGKKMIILSCVFCIIGSLTFIGSLIFIRSLIFIGSEFAGLCIDGIGIGILTTCCPLYIAEITPKLIRGRIITFYQVSITFGIFLASIIKSTTIRTMDYFLRDPVYLIPLLIPAIFVLIGMLTVSESYRWLLSKNRKDEAIEVIRKLKQIPETGIAEFVKIILEANIIIEEESQKRFMLFRILRNKISRKSLYFGCSLQILGQIVGINAIMYYSSFLLEYYGTMSHQDALLFGSLINFFNFIPSFVAYKLIDKIGRRKLALISLFGILFSLVIIAVDSQLNDVRHPKIKYDNYNCSNYLNCDDCVRNGYCMFCQIRGNSGYSCTETRTNCNSTLPIYDVFNYCPLNLKIHWILLFGIIFYVISFSIGMGPIPWVVTSEIYPAWCRSYNMALSTAVNWLFNLLITVIFQINFNLSGLYATFWIYSAFTICGIALVHKYAPETNQIDLERMNYILT